MPFRSNKSQRLGRQRNIVDQNASVDEDDNTNPSNPATRESIQGLSHQQLVSRQRQLWQRQGTDNPGDSNATQDMKPTNRPSRMPSTSPFHSSSSASSSIQKQSDPSASTSRVNSIVHKFEAKIDLEAAVNLLQELKKNASPEELVALHRALLPVKDETPTSPQLPWSSERAYPPALPPTRKRSVMPPGLATRNGMLEDVLRKPGESTSSATNSIPSRSTPWLNPPMKAKSRGVSPDRLGTPNEQSVYHAGAFRPGTLRVTNGRASPDPSIVSRVAGDGDEIGKDFKDDTISRWQQKGKRPENGKNFLAATSDNARPFPERAPMNPRPPLVRPISFHVESDDARKAQLQLDSHLPKRHSFVETMNPPKRDHTVPVQQQSVDPATHFSEEYMLDCEITASPFEEKDNIFEVTKRLSMACNDDNEVPNQDSKNERVRALSQLGGDRVGEGPMEHDGHRNPIQHSNDTILTNTFNQTSNHTLGKTDNVHCSDGPRTPRRRRLPWEMEETLVYPSANEEVQNQHQDASTTRDINHPLHAVVDAVHSSPNLDDEQTLSQPSNTKKSPLSLFKTKSKPAKHSGIGALGLDTGSPDANHKVAKSATMDDVTRDHHEKHQRKLQKPMPKDVQRKRAKTMENLRDAGMVSPPAVQPNNGGSTYCSPVEPRSTTVKPRTEIHIVPGADSIDLASGVAAIPLDPVSPPEEQPKSRFARMRGKSFSRKWSKSAAELAPSSPQERYSGTANAPDDTTIPIPPAHRFTDGLEVIRQRRHNAEDSTFLYPASHVPIAQTIMPNSRSIVPQSEKSAAAMPQRNGRYYSNDFGRSQPAETAANSAPEVRHWSTVQDQHQNGRAGRNYVDGIGDLPPIPPTHVNRVLPPISSESSRAVEDGLLGWEGQFPSRTSNSEVPSWMSLPSQRAKRQSVPATDEIPTLPALPADVESRVNKADQIVAQKFRNNHDSPPTVSDRNNVAFATHNSDEDKSMPTWRVRELQRRPDTNNTAPNRLQVAMNNAAIVEDQIDLAEPMRRKNHENEPRPLPSQTHDVQHAEWLGWERQAALWRQRRDAVQKSYEESPSDTTVRAPPDNTQYPKSGGAAPEIMFSRYITPLPAESANNARDYSKDTADRALKYAQSYTKLIDGNTEDKSLKPDMSRTDSGLGTTVFVGTQSHDRRPAKADVPRTNSAVSATSTTTVSTTTVSRYSWTGSRSSQSSRGSVDTARSPGVRTRTNTVVTHHRAPTTVTSKLVPRPAPNPAAKSTDSLALPVRPDLAKRSSESLFDRYSGGMNFGWDREAGFGGSAGTRTPNTFDPENRKSVAVSERFGLDLSDIPVFLRKGPV